MTTIGRSKFAAACLFSTLAGCSTAPTGIDANQIRERITVTTDTALKNKDRVYRSVPVASYSINPSGLSIEAKLYLSWAEDNDPTSPNYRIVAQYRTHGAFGGTNAFLILDEAPKTVPIGSEQDKRCFTGSGTTCWWTQEYQLPSYLVHAAEQKQAPITFVITNVFGTPGWKGQIPFAALSAFSQGLRDRGISIHPPINK